MQKKTLSRANYNGGYNAGYNGRTLTLNLAGGEAARAATTATFRPGTGLYWEISMAAFAMGPQEKYTAFLRHVSSTTSKFTKKRSSLRGLCEYMEDQIQAYYRHLKPIVPFRSVDHAKSKCQLPHDSRLMKYDVCLRRLVECWGRALDYPNCSPAMRLVKEVAFELNACALFACADAKTFEDCIKKGKKKEVLDRAKEKDTLFTAVPQIPVGGLGAMRAGVTTAWDADRLKRIHKTVYGKKVGECTNFGYAAAHTMSRACELRNLNYRIEVVSYRMLSKKKTQTVTHVFCLVNRGGGSMLQTVPGRGKIRKRRLPPFADWGEECVIVDTWLGSLGWGSYFTVQDYPMKSMLDPVYQEMDSLVTQADPHPFRRGDFS